MSLGIIVNGPEGIVLAAESRVTITSEPADHSAPPIHVNFDNATKLLSFSKPNTAVGCVVYGLAAIGMRTANSFVPEFEAGLDLDTRLSVEDFAGRLSGFFMDQWGKEMSADYDGPEMIFSVGGFDAGEPYGRVFQFSVPRNAAPLKLHGGGFGIVWGGQREFVDRLIQGYDSKVPDIVSRALDLTSDQVAELRKALSAVGMNIPLTAMALQDCVNLAIFFVRTTIAAQRLTVGIRGCGGPIDVATITRREGFNAVQKKAIAGERTEFYGR